MRGTEGTCPGCDGTGIVAEPCNQRGCQKRGLHFIADTHWERAHPDNGEGPDPVIGQMVGDFLVVELIGAGGFGKVYLAYQTPLLRLKGALKLIDVSTDNVEFSRALLKKFQSEAEVLAHLTHPNIVRLLKYGLHNKRPYLVMEFVDQGRTLRDEIYARTTDGRGFSADEILEIFDQVLNGLGAAHAESIIHRDIKPENLMLQSVVGNPHYTRLLDFGLAKFVEHSTDTRWHLGSPNYMSPEQISRKNLGPWTDLYAVTVMLFELVTGRRPFPGATEEQVLVMKIKDDFDPLSEVADLDFPDITIDFLSTGLAREPEQRFQDVESMRQAMIPAVEAVADRLGNTGVKLDAATARLATDDIIEIGDPNVGSAGSTRRADDEVHQKLQQLEPTRNAAGDDEVRDEDDEISSEAEIDGGDADSGVKPTGPEEEDEGSDESSIPAQQPEQQTDDESPSFRKPWLVATVVVVMVAVGFGVAGFNDSASRVMSGFFGGDTTAVEDEPDQEPIAAAIGDDSNDDEVDEGGNDDDSPALDAGVVDEADADQDTDEDQAPVDPLADYSVRDIALGKFHTCILLQDGDVRCWGANAEGELGLGRPGRIGNTEPAEQANVVELGEPAVAIDAAGDYNAAFSCAVLESGALRCWGSNHSGQLGLGIDVRRIGRDELPTDFEPIDVGGPVRQVAAGAMQYSTHACALLEDGQLRCWGDNRYGQLGLGISTRTIGDTEPPAAVGPVDVDGEVIQVDTGKFHTCALTDGGDVYCWGRNHVGQLGYGHTDNVGVDEVPADLEPVDVGGAVQQISAGRAHTCALLEEGTARCWGWNDHGQLGYGHTDNIGDSDTPAEAGDVELDAGIEQILAGGLHTCALLDDGGVRCWGDSRFGQLGYGNRRSVGDDNTPDDIHNVFLGGDVVLLEVANYHNCALLEDDTMRCWGMNEFGQLGYGHTDHIGGSESPASAGAVPAL